MKNKEVVGDNIGDLSMSKEIIDELNKKTTYIYSCGDDAKSFSVYAKYVWRK